MDKSDIKKINLSKDIDEIKEVLYNWFSFDRQKAEEIIRKHNLSNSKVAAMNSPTNPGYVKFENSTDEMIKNNLSQILKILEAEYYEEIIKEKNNI